MGTRAEITGVPQSAISYATLFIYCEKAKRGKYTKDNYYSQFMRHSKRVKELEQELEELKRMLSSI